jgi:hypothetical protein
VEHVDFGELQAERREMAEKTLRVAGPDEIRELVNRLFEGQASHPWLGTCQGFLDENSRSTLLRAELPDHHGIVFCPAAHQGLWYKHDGALAAVGVLGPRGIEALEGLAKAKGLVS